VAKVPLTGTVTPDSAVTDGWVQGTQSLDILFVVDDSCSMADEQAALAANFDHFIKHAVTTGSDFHLAVTTTDTFSVNGAFRGSPGFLTPLTPQLDQAFASRAVAGTSGSGFEQPLEALLRAVSPPATTGTNAGFLRAAVPLVAVIVTDAVEQSGRAVASYVASLRAVKDNRTDLVNVSVVGPFTPPSATCQLDSNVDPGRYQEVITATAGVRSDICTTDWAHDLDVIGSSLLGLATRFPLKATPDLGQPIVVTVNGVVVNAWRYDVPTRLIVFDVPPAQGAVISAAYRTACF
jgi:hypothetical protein